MNTEEFIKKAKLIHGDLYDYSQVNYINARTKITIICPVHGIFEQNPNAHLQGHKCPLCYKATHSKKPLTLDLFIQKAKSIHNDDYDYSLITEYKNTRTKVPIKCNKNPDHGIFYQIPKSHLAGGGCPKCGYDCQALSQKQFLQKCYDKHGYEKYDYSSTKFISLRKFIKVKCKSCNEEFEQTADNHLYADNCCPNCEQIKYDTTSVKEIISNKYNNKYDCSLIEYKNTASIITVICNDCGCKINVNASRAIRESIFCEECDLIKRKNEFIKKANDIFGNKFEYDMSNFKNITSEITIKCLHHNKTFKQICNHHLNNVAPICPDCLDEYNKLELIRKRTEFIKKSSTIHNSKYDYSRVEEDYKNSVDKVWIGCPKHSFFKQSPASHLSGSGCPICNKSNGETEVERFLKENDIKYSCQQKFDGCLSDIGRHLYFDFYLPDKNIAIEYNGAQHYKVVERFGGEEAFNKIVSSDTKKVDFCKNNNIRLIIIKYTENVYDVLTKELL